MSILVNFLAFQAGWFASVLGAAQNMPWVGPAVVLAIVVLHLRQARRPELEAGLLVASGIIGLCFDSLLVSLGWVTYPSGLISTSLAPYWIVTMWVLFATTLNSSMAWLKGRRVLAAVLGAIAGPMSYLAGAKLGGIEFVERGGAVIFLALGWAAAMPVLITLADKLNGFGDPVPVEGERQ
ncbi:MAG: DUF2878 domain-containing protein [Gammaproteobacteria bacterium]|nr:DUF2878 domain-containing protein [Gammaproteobacteria bacterium]